MRAASTSKMGTGEEQLVVCAEAFSSDADRLAVEASTPSPTKSESPFGKSKIVPQGALPRTSSGKPQRRKTKQMFLEGTLPKRGGKEQNDEGVAGA